MPTQQMFLGLGAGGYEVERSLRFNAGDSTYIQRVSAPGNTTTWTLSFWMKFCEVTGATNQRLWSCDGNSGTYDMFKIEFYGGSDNNRRLAFIDNLHASSGVRFTTNRSFRDPSAWYHIVLAVDTTQSTASNRVKIYINGEQESDWLSGAEHNHQPNQNHSTSVNANLKTHTWGRSYSFGSTSADYFDGYLAEIHHIDGSQLTPSSFAETDTVTGQYKPKKYSGSYGTNGYHLNFSDNSNTTSTTLGKDSAGSNNFTCNNFATTDAVKDTPTNNFCTLNPLDEGAITLSEGNLKATRDDPHETVMGTFGMPSGKWYFEVYNGTSNADGTLVGIGSNVGILNSHVGSTTTSWGYENSGLIWNNSSGTGSNSSLSNGDIFGVAYDADAGTVKFYKNNTLQSSSYSSVTADYYMPQVSLYHSGSSVIANFGQDSSFAGNKTAQGNKDGNGQGDFYYSPPSGYKALCSANLSNPLKIPNKHFEPKIYTPNSGNLSVTGFEFQPDLLWLKSRAQGYRHYLFDSVRGTGQKALSSDRTDEEGDDSGSLTSFDSTGFTTSGSSGFNDNGSGTDGAIAWAWKGGGSAVSNSNGTITSSVSANNTAGFSIVTYTGTGSNATIGHGLGVTPQVFIVKKRNADGTNWRVYHHKLNNGSSPEDFNLVLNGTFDQLDRTDFNDTAPTSTTFAVGTHTSTNNSSDTYVAYCFSEVEGYSKFGKYTGNNNANGTFVYLGFRPALLIIKRLESGYSWYMIDNKRDPINRVSENLYANDDMTTYDYAIGDLLSNGFKLRNTGSDTNQVDDHIYLAFAESPFKYSRAR